MANRVGNILLIVVGILTMTVASSTVEISTNSVQADHLNTSGIDDGLATLIQQQAAAYHRDSWNISLSQYESWIALISLGEAGEDPDAKIPGPGAPPIE